MTIRRRRSWLCHWLSVKSYSPDAPPKSMVAKVVAASLGVSSPVQPVRLSGSTRGAVKRVAETKLGKHPDPEGHRRPGMDSTT